MTNRISRLYTTGHDSWWDRERCEREGVMLCLIKGGETFSVCPYPGRGLKFREEDLVMECYQHSGFPLTNEELDAIIQQVKDEEGAVVLANALKQANEI